MMFFLAILDPSPPYDGILIFSVNPPYDVFNQPLPPHIPYLEQEELWIKLFQPL